MITREMIIDAVGKLMTDLADGTWGLPEDRGGPMWAHPAIVELFDHLPAIPGPGAAGQIERAYGPVRDV